MTVYDEATAMSGDIAELRHAIHREPEIGLDLPGRRRRSSPPWTGSRLRSAWARS